MAKIWKPSKEEAKAFAIKMSEIKAFCEEFNIIKNYKEDSYYFELNGNMYRVSNHSKPLDVDYDEFGNKIKYYEYEGVILIQASKTRIMDIYMALKNGNAVDSKGNVTVEETEKKEEN